MPSNPNLQLNVQNFFCLPARNALPLLLGVALLLVVDVIEPVACGLEGLVRAVESGRGQREFGAEGGRRGSSLVDREHHAISTELGNDVVEDLGVEIAWRTQAEVSVRLVTTPTSERTRCGDPDIASKVLANAQLHLGGASRLVDTERRARSQRAVTGECHGCSAAVTYSFSQWSIRHKSIGIWS